MKDTKFIAGSLSNDLFRVATLTHRGSTTGAQKFLKEAKAWSKKLKKQKTKKYIRNIANDVANQKNLSHKDAEKLLMYGVLLQNYSLHL